MKRSANICLLGTSATGVEILRARLKYNMSRGAGEFCSELKLSDNGKKWFRLVG